MPGPGHRFACHAQWQYELYRNAGRGRQPCPCGTAITGVNVSADGAAFCLPIHGQINKSAQTALHAGMCTGMLQVTVERLRELTAPERAVSEAARGLCLWGLRAHAW